MTKKDVNENLRKQPGIHCFEKNAIKQLEWNIIYALDRKICKGCSFDWVTDHGAKNVLRGYASDITVHIPSTAEWEECKTCHGFVWINTSGMVHMYLSYTSEINI